MKLSKFKLSVCTLFTLSITATHAYELSDIVDTSSGQIQGVAESNLVRFQGIPYAEAPIGARRWEAPVEKRKLDAVYYAGNLANTCATTTNLGGFSKISDSEDCLYLNVYVPKNVSLDKNQKAPVLFWIPGGGLQTGSANEYDPQYFIDKGIIVVTINYRLGPFGFFYNPSTTNKDAAFINLGLMDQQAALKWVNKNIESFGGDAKNITIFGESAGGQSVLANIFSPLSKNLFQKAIAASGSYHADLKNVADAKQVTHTIAQKLNCVGDAAAVSACLKSKPTEQFLTPDISSLFNDGFFIDNTTLNKSFYQSIESNEFNVSSMINGFNTDEGSFFAGVIENSLGRKMNYDDYVGSLTGLYGKNTQKHIIKNKKPNTSTDYTQAFSEDLGKYKFVCPTITFNNLFSKKVALYSYEFADKSAPQYIKPISIAYGAYHTGELAYLFKDFRGANGSLTKLNPSQAELSKTMVNYWANFIKTGNPNGDALVNWAQYQNNAKNTLLFKTDGAKLIQERSSNRSCPK
ncbi:carboxylesterase/lipase family protein [Acinetobacter dispersus]|uniref:carboxylesterase/lipase family protein n=1 Tax=Acinetobacter dispersus TaxID=70348 RepID=UPI0021CD9CD7|nr:carboxylesterase family protein [Acinetobacter dispersus]MCU4336401.1 carboxylesterase family protein [Acinetobacter dispersus]